MSIFRKTVGFLRLLVGALFLIAPGCGSWLFLIPFTPEVSLAGRLFGVREVVLGSLLWRASNSEEGRRLFTQTIAVDSLDLVATAVCYIEGNLGLLPAMTTVGGGILVFLALGFIGRSKEDEYKSINSQDSL